MSARTRRSAVLGLALVVVAVVIAWLVRGERGAETTAPRVSGAAADAPSELPTIAAPVEAEDSAVAPLAAEDGSATIASDAPATGTLIVRVIWASDRTPAAEVGVFAVFWDGPDPRFSKPEGLTDETGRWEVPDAPAGRASVYLDRANGDNVVVRAGETAELLLEIPAAIFVRGLVVDADEQAVAGADVWMKAGGAGQGFIVARSGADGRFTLRDVGKHNQIGALADGHVSSLLVTISDDGSHVCDVTLRLGAAGAHITGRVLDTAGAPVPGAVVLVGPEEGWQPPEVGNRILVSGQPPRRAIVDAQGAFAVRDVPPGKTPVAARARGHSLWTGIAALQAGDNDPVEVVLPDSATLSGIVTDSGGRRVAGATVQTDTWGEMDWASTESGADGRYELKDLPLGYLKLESSLKGLGKEATQLNVVAGAHLEWNPRLTSGLQIVGRVADANGAPVVGHHVDGYAHVPGQSTWVQCDTDQQGRFLLMNCADAEHELVVRTPDLLTIVASKQNVRPGPDEVVLQVADVRRSAFFVGRVLDARGQVPELATVAASDPKTGNGEPKSIQADTGEFRLGPLLPGEWDLYVLVSGHTPRKCGRFTLAADEARDVGTITLPDPGRVRLHVALPEGVSPDNVMAALSMNDRPNGFFRRQDDAVAVWVSDPVDPGDYIVHVITPFNRADRACILPASAQVHVEANEEARVEIVAERGVVQHVEVTTSRAEPPGVAVRLLDMAGAEVRAGEATWPEERTGTAPLTGHAYLTARPGSYTLQVECEGQLLLQQSVTLPAGANAGPDVHTVVP